MVLCLCVFLQRKAEDATQKAAQIKAHIKLVCIQSQIQQKSRFSLITMLQMYQGIAELMNLSPSNIKQP
jgi:hypothetical protein